MERQDFALFAGPGRRLGENPVVNMPPEVAASFFERRLQRPFRKTCDALGILGSTPIFAAASYAFAGENFNSIPSALALGFIEACLMRFIAYPQQTLNDAAGFGRRAAGAIASVGGNALLALPSFLGSAAGLLLQCCAKAAIGLADFGAKMIQANPGASLALLTAAAAYNNLFPQQLYEQYMPLVALGGVTYFLGPDILRNIGGHAGSAGPAGLFAVGLVIAMCFSAKGQEINNLPTESVGSALVNLTELVGGERTTLSAFGSPVLDSSSHPPMRAPDFASAIGR